MRRLNIATTVEVHFTPSREGTEAAYLAILESPEGQKSLRRDLVLARKKIALWTMPMFAVAVLLQVSARGPTWGWLILGSQVVILLWTLNAVKMDVKRTAKQRAASAWTFVKEPVQEVEIQASSDRFLIHQKGARLEYSWDYVWCRAWNSWVILQYAMSAIAVPVSAWEDPAQAQAFVAACQGFKRDAAGPGSPAEPAAPPAPPI